MKIIIDFIPHEEQRYETPGDYYYDENGNLVVKISLMGNSDSEFAVALHETIEAYLCQRAGISIEEIDAWDNAYDDRPDAKDFPEPGNHPDAPYHSQHMFALEMEKRFIDFAGHDWKEHDEHVLSL